MTSDQEAAERTALAACYRFLLDRRRKRLAAQKGTQTPPAQASGEKKPADRRPAVS